MNRKERRETKRYVHKEAERGKEKEKEQIRRGGQRRKKSGGWLVMLLCEKINISRLEQFHNINNNSNNSSNNKSGAAQKKMSLFAIGQ